jgi:hypothetical protein
VVRGQWLARLGSACHPLCTGLSASRRIGRGAQYRLIPVNTAYYRLQKNKKTCGAFKNGKFGRFKAGEIAFK